MKYVLQSWISFERTNQAQSPKKEGQTALDLEQREEIKALLETCASCPSFFVELFTKANITDVAHQREYTKVLLKERLNTLSRIVEMNREDFKYLNILLGDGSPLSRQPKQCSILSLKLLKVS